MKLIMEVLFVMVLILSASFISCQIDKMNRADAPVEFQEQKIDLLHPATIPCEPESRYKLEV